MKFCISGVNYWESVGFNVKNWRQSTDGKKAVCHYKFAETLVGDVDNNSEIEVFDINDPAFSKILGDEFEKEDDD